jgi:hypothetical protein
MKLLQPPLLGLTFLGLSLIWPAETSGPKTQSAPSLDGAFRVAAICVKTGEKVSGAVKSCFYNCAGEGRELTVGSRAICPLTITY